MHKDELTSAIYASVTHDDAFGVLLRLLAEFFECPAAALVYVDPRRPATDLALGYGLVDAAAQRRYKEHFAAIDPAPAALARLKIGEATTTDRLFPPEQRGPSRFLDEFYRPLGMRASLGGPIANQDGRFGVIAAISGLDRRPFDDDDIAMFAQFTPHLACAVELRRAFFEMEHDLLALGRAVEPAAAGIMTFGNDGILRHANQAARAILARDDAFRLDMAGRLKFCAEANQSQLKDFLAGRCSESFLMRVKRRGVKLPYGVKVWRNSGERARGPQGFGLTIADPDNAPGDATELLRAVLGTPDTSTRLVVALVAGEELGANARRTGLSINTVKFHLKTAFAATGTRRQAELVRLASGLIRDLS